jgi:hypothetical protein
VDVGVADAGVLDVDQDVVGEDVASLDGDRDEGFGSGRGCVGVDSSGHVTILPDDAWARGALADPLSTGGKPVLDLKRLRCGLLRA